MGCLVYQIATLKPPFLAENYAALYMKISKSKYEKILNFPKNLSVFIDKLLKKNPKLRPSCSEILQFEEFKVFSNEKTDKKRTKKDQIRKSSYMKPINLITNISKDTFSLRKKPEFSPLDKSRKYIKNQKKNYLNDINNSAYPLSRRHNHVFSPRPQISPYRKVTENSKLFKDNSLPLIDSSDSKINSRRNSLYKIMTPKTNLKQLCNIERNDELSHLSSTKNTADNNTKIKARIETMSNKLTNPSRFKKAAGVYLLNECSPDKSIIRKRSLACFNIANIKSTPKPLLKISSAKKLFYQNFG